MNRINKLHICVLCNNLLERIAYIFKRLSEIFTPVSCDDYYASVFKIEIIQCIIIEFIIISYCCFSTNMLVFFLTLRLA